MKRSSTMFLQIVLAALGLGVLAFIIWEPTAEGVNAHATFSQIYFDDPFLLYAYSAAIFFFVALCQAFVLLGLIGRDEVFSNRGVSALRTIKYCAIAIVAATAAPVAYLMIVRPGDDIAGGVAMGVFIILVSGISAAAAAVFERMLRTAVDLKSENDLTV